MIRHDNGVIQFLIGLGVFTDEEVKTVREAQVGPIIKAMLQRNAISYQNEKEARKLLRELLTATNQMKRLKLQMSLVRMVSGKLHERMTISKEKAHAHKEKVTSGYYPAVAVAKSSND